MGVVEKKRPAKGNPADEVSEQAVESVFEKAIILRPTSMNIGTITTNAEIVLEAVKEKATQYMDVSKYEGDDKQAKADRALLRKQKDATKTTIASIQEAWNKPMEPFLDVSKKILKEFDYAIETIDGWVKDGEEKEKEKKRELIQTFFDSKKFDLVPLDRFFNSKWLNKTYDMRDVKKEIEETISGIYGNIKILENIAEHGMTAKAFYLETLDMGAAMRQVETLKANAERLAREKVEREEREHKAQIAQNAAEERRETREASKAETAQSLAASAMDIEESMPSTPSTPSNAPVYRTFTLRLTGTDEGLKIVKECMTANNVAYEKIA